MESSDEEDFKEEMSSINDSEMDTQSIQDTNSVMSSDTDLNSDVDDRNRNTDVLNFAKEASEIVHAKNKKKRVSFPENDKNLVCIREIPARLCSPLSEEMTPFDTRRLTDDMSSMKLGYRPTREPYNLRKVPGSVGLDIVGRLASLHSTANSFNALSAAFSKLTAPSIPEMPVRLQKRKAKVKNVTLDSAMGEPARLINTPDKVKRKLRSAGKKQTAAASGSAGKKHTMSRDNKNQANGIKKKAKCSDFRNGANKGSNVQDALPNATLKLVHHNHSRQLQRDSGITTIDTRNGEEESVQVLSHHPFGGTGRAVSAGHIPSTARLNIGLPSMDHSNTSTRLPLAEGARSFSSVQTRRLYAWQIANGIGLPNGNPGLDTPCIAQMW